jgi:thiol:disulfide interchange protein DsbD
MRYHFVLLSMLCINFHLYPLDMTSTVQNISDTQKTVELNVALSPTEKILKQTINVSLDSPHTLCGTVAMTPQAQNQYLPEFFDSKEIFTDQLTLTVPINLDTHQPVQAQLFISFLSLPTNTITQKIIPLSFNQEEPTAQTLSASAATSTPNYPAARTEQPKSFTHKLQDLVQKTDSMWIRLLFAFLLGLLLSLTPCIYPMIPITIGILHRQAEPSLLKNFFGSCCYAFGISTTFALLGLLAASAGASFGSLLSKPLFVIVLVLFIGYMSLTMIGVIDLKVPGFLQRSVNMNNALSPFLSAYFFGLISGSVASPCVSPGLALLLTIVATMGNIFAGFSLLFCFGIGLSTPLIIIGTFSSSMQLLPRAGTWMVEIKKALGFVMLATCLYYLNNILPASVMLLLLVVYLLFAALFYIIDAQKEFEPKIKTIKSLAGIILLAASVVFGFRWYEQMHKKPQDIIEHGVIWSQDYVQAQEQALQDKKLLLLDFWANHCTICKAIEKKIFHKESVHQALKDRFIFIKVDCTSTSDENTNILKNKFKVFAQPAILIVDPNSEQVLKRWSSEPYSMTPEEFVKAAQSV